MAIPEDRQLAAIRDAQETITQTRAAAQQAAQRLAQAQATLAAMPDRYGAFIDDAKGGRHAATWDGLAEAFTALKTDVDAAVARAEVQALRDLDV